MPDRKLLNRVGLARKKGKPFAHIREFLPHLFRGEDGLSLGDHLGEDKRIHVVAVGMAAEKHVALRRKARGQRLRNREPRTRQPRVFSFRIPPLRGFRSPGTSRRQG